MTSNRVRYANGNRVRDRLLEMRISVRELARRSGTSETTVRAILHRNEISGSTQLADIYRMLDTLSLDPGDLLDPTTPDEPDDTPTDDTQTLAALLATEKTMHAPERLATALGWTLDRLYITLTDLDAHLRAVGLRIHRNRMGITIRPADDRAQQASQRLAHLHDHEDGIHQGTARVLYTVYTGTMSARETRKDQQFHLGALKNRGAITFGTGSGNRFTLTDDTAYAFDVD
ncbi:helix-turn-helix domain-containing protein [Nocardioides aurantiacus]|uniref:Cro/C1-type helix-turn-helix DNA-binding protein n=1 Tax=Nocardioides aurantiacus TaxID=86796 RepID=A0A3N2CUT2_9ACTN|nr:helix-turn-helix transcriptional regulator [Nocardioides aurantiacus]ROR90984.1 Cro/C1-type helix-turn-helix DNA-binding protein [Nocardioides aurantiacus]